MNTRTSIEKKNIKVISLILIIAMLIALVTSCGAKSTKNSVVDTNIEKTVNFISNNVTNPTIASVGGEWSVKGLAESGIFENSDYFDGYYDNVTEIVKNEKGILHESYYTEYARVIIGICAIGKNPCDVAGYDLTVFLDDYEIITNQGPNAASYALAAANCAGVVLDNQDEYISYIIEEIDNGAVRNDQYYCDYISMALLGLSFYTDREDIRVKIDEYIELLADMQLDDGGFGSCESDAEAIVALCQNGIDLTNDNRFIKKDKNLLDTLLDYSMDDGSFCHVTENKQTDFMATEKALIAMDAIKLQQKGKKLY